MTTDNHGMGAFRGAIDPNSRFLATVAGNRVCLWDIETGRQLAAFRNEAGSGSDLVFSRDGTELFVGS